MIRHPQTYWMFHHPHIFNDVPPSTQGAEPHEFRLLMQTQAKVHTARATTQRPVMQTSQKTFGGLLVNLCFCPGFWGVRPIALSVRSVFLWGGSCGFVSDVGFAPSVLGSCFSKVRTASLQGANPRTGRSQCFTGADQKNGNVTGIP